MWTLWGQTYPGHMQAVSTMTLSSNTDTSFRAKKIVTFNSKMEFA